MNYKKKYLEYKLKYLTAKKIVNKKQKVLKGGETDSEYLKNSLSIEDLEKKLKNYLKNKNKFKILLICYAGWCGYCKQLKEPINKLYEELGSEAENKLLTIDLSIHTKFNDKYDFIQSYPTLLLLSNKNEEINEDDLFSNFNIMNIEDRTESYLKKLLLDD
tara:strand:- start:284 stop:766 length:483 start_codon:yes stop_codon:yes gene_type:complete